MTALTAKERRLIEDQLGRELTDGELREVDSLEALTREQLEVVAAIHRRSATVPLVYLRAVVPSSRSPANSRFADQIDEIIATRFHLLGDLPLFEHHAGRALSVAEKTRVATLPELSPAHIAVAATLARQKVVVALMYLRDLVRSASSEECEVLAERLAAEPDGKP
jgi:hypothetical protein